MLDKLQAGIAYPAFYEMFRQYIPNLNIIEKVNDIRNLDLIIFSGGEDINPRIYYEENTHSGYNDKRDAIELEILDNALNYGSKILGVCRGHQLINARLGGKLVQDILFCGFEPHNGRHKLNYIPSTSITRYIFGDSLVNSMHHQGVIHPGKGLNGTSVYGRLLESCESLNIYTVQFHPEMLGGELGLKFFETVALWVFNRSKLMGLIAESKKKIISNIDISPSASASYPVSSTYTDFKINMDRIRQAWVEEMRAGRERPQEVGEENEPPDTDEDEIEFDDDEEFDDENDEEFEDDGDN